MARAPRKACGICLRAFPPHKIAQHQQTCTTKRCQVCRTDYLKTAQHVCTHKRCHKCRKDFLRGKNHICSNSFVRCKKCRVFISIKNFETHDCKRKHCIHCDKAWPVNKFDGHLCAKQRCHRCKRNIPTSDFADHVCDRRICLTCRLMVPLSESESHVCAVDGKRCCHSCQKTLLTSEIPDHVCEIMRCRICNRWISISDLISHVCDPRTECGDCHWKIKNEDMEAHQTHCPALEKVAQGLCTKSLGCIEPVTPPYKYCKKHGTMERETKFRQRVRRVLARFEPDFWSAKIKPFEMTREVRLDAELEVLQDKLREHHETQKFPIDRAWRTHRELYEKRSSKLVFYDLETSFSFKPGTKYRWIFSICMRDAARNTIVHTKVNQEMTIGELYEAGRGFHWESDVLKWYGERSNEVTPGMTLSEIADLMQKAGIDKDCYSMEQSTHFFDHDNLYFNFREIGKQHLVPKRKNVLRLIPAMRLAFEQFSLDHSLSTMHRLLCPEDQHLVERAHHEDADEEMLHIQAGIYFKGTLNKAKPSRVQLYCTRGGGKKKYPLFQEKDGDLLTPRDFEVIKSMEDVIANGDELEDLLELDEEIICEDELEFDDWISDDADDDVVWSREGPSTVYGHREAHEGYVPEIRKAGLRGTIASGGPRQAESSNAVQSANPLATPTSSQRSTAKTQAPLAKAQSRLTFQASVALPSCQADTKEGEGGTDQALKSSAKRPVPPMVEKLNGDPNAETSKKRRIQPPRGQTTKYRAPTEGYAQAAKTTHEMSVCTNADSFVEESMLGTTSPSAAADDSKNVPTSRSMLGKASRSDKMESSKKLPKAKTKAKHTRESKKKKQAREVASKTKPKRTRESKKERQAREVAEITASHRPLRSFFNKQQ